MRFHEIDIIRGFALVLMIIYHIFYDLDFFGILQMNHILYSQTVIIVPILFITIMGVSLSISYDKKGTEKIIPNARLISFCAVGITLVSLVAIPKQPIYFGILHCIGMSMFLSIPLLKLKAKYLMMGSLITLITGYIISFNISQVNFIVYMLGTHNQTISAIDYFPLLPWFGYALLGISLGKILYKDGERQFQLPKIFRKPNILEVPGKHSLEFYLLHQPIIVIALKIFMYMRYVKI